MAVAMVALPPFWQFVVLLATHWVGDFVFQSSFQALNKSKRVDVLSLHVAILRGNASHGSRNLVRLGVGHHIRSRERRAALCD